MSLYLNIEKTNEAFIAMILVNSCINKKYTSENRKLEISLLLLIQPNQWSLCVNIGDNLFAAVYERRVRKQKSI